jgi:hypothetical protein
MKLYKKRHQSVAHTSIATATTFCLEVSYYLFSVSYFATLLSIISLKSINAFNCLHVDPSFYTFCSHVCSYRITTHMAATASKKLSCSCCFTTGITLFLSKNISAMRLLQKLSGKSYLHIIITKF